MNWTLAALAAALVPAATPTPNDLPALVGTRRALDAADLASAEDAGVLRRIGAPPRRHTGAARVAWTDDGASFQTYAPGGGLVVWDGATGERTREVDPSFGDVGGGPAVLDIVALTDGSFAALGDDGTAGRLDGASLALDGRARKLAPSRALVASPGRDVVVGLPEPGEREARVAILDTERGRARRGPKMPTEVRSLAVSNGATRFAAVLAAADDDRAPGVTIVDAKGRPVGVDALDAYSTNAEPGGREAWTVAFTSDGDALAIGGRGVVTLLDLERGDVWFSAQVGDVPITFLDASRPDLIVVGARDGRVALLERGSGEIRAERRLHSSAVRDVALSGDLSRSVSVGDDGDVRLFDLETGEEILGTGWLSGPVGALAFSRDGRVLAVGGAAGGIGVAVESQEPRLAEPHRHRGPVLALGVFDEKRLFSVAADDLPADGPSFGGRLRREPAMDIESRRIVSAAVQIEQSLASLALDDGRHLLFRIGGIATKTDLDFSLLATAIAPTSGGFALLTAKKELMIAAAGAAEFAYEELSAGPSRATRDPRVGLRFVDDATVAVELDDDTLQLLRRDGSEVRRIDLRATTDSPATGDAFAFADRGRWVVTERRGEGLIVLDGTTGERVVELRYPAAGATSVAVSTDLSRVALGQRDGTTLVWELARFSDWLRSRGRQNAFFPVVDALEGPAESLAASKRKSITPDVAGSHLVRGASLLRGLPPGPRRDDLDVALRKGLTERGVVDEAFRAMSKEVAAAWAALGRAYARRDASRMALECSLAADLWDRGSGASVRSAAGVEAPRPEPVVDAAPAQTDDAADDALAILPASTNGVSRKSDGALWVPSRARAGRAVLARKPAAFRRVALDAELQVEGVVGVGVLVGVSARGNGGFAVYATLDRGGAVLRMTIDDRTTGQRLILRRFRLETLPTEIRLEVEVDGKKIVGRWNGVHSVTVGARKPVRGHVGFEVFQPRGTANGVTIRAVETDPVGKPIQVAADPGVGASPASLELPLDERLDDIETDLAGTGPDLAALLVDLHRLRFEVERLGEDEARRTLVQRIDGLEEQHDPLAARRRKALGEVGSALAGRAEALAAAGRPFTALALFDLALVRDETGVRPRFEAAAEALEPALAARRGVPVEPYGEEDQVAGGASFLSRAVDAGGLEWTEKDGVLSIETPTDTNAVLVSKEPLEAGDLDLSMQVLAEGDTTVGMLLAVQLNWRTLSVQRARVGRDCRLVVTEWTGRAWSRIGSARTRFTREAAEGWMTVHVRYEAASRKLSVNLGLADPLEIVLKEPLRAGAVGLIVDPGTGPGRARFRNLRLGP